MPDETDLIDSALPFLRGRNRLPDTLSDCPLGTEAIILNPFHPQSSEEDDIELDWEDDDTMEQDYARMHRRIDAYDRRRREQDRIAALQEFYGDNPHADNPPGSIEPITYEDVDESHPFYEELLAAVQTILPANDLFDGRDLEILQLKPSPNRSRQSPPSAQRPFHPDTVLLSLGHKFQDRAARNGTRLSAPSRGQLSPLPEGYHRRVMHGRVRIIGPRGVVRFQSSSSPTADHPQHVQRSSIQGPLDQWLVHPSQSKVTYDFGTPSCKQSPHSSGPGTFFDRPSSSTGNDETQASKNRRRRRRSQVDTSVLRPMRAAADILPGDFESKDYDSDGNSLPED